MVFNRGYGDTDMKGMKGTLVDENLFNNIVMLANNRAEAEYGRLPNGVDLADKESISEALTSTKESEALKNAIADLSPDDAKELSAIMDLGRIDSDDLGVERAILLHREDAEARNLDDVKQSLAAKIPLAKYLLDGAKKLNNLQS